MLDGSLQAAHDSMKNFDQVFSYIYVVEGFKTDLNLTVSLQSDPSNDHSP